MSLSGVELVIEAAESHGESSEPDHEVGDLQDALRAAWDLMSGGQRKALVMTQEKFLLDELDSDDAGAEIEEACRLADADARGDGSVVGELVGRFPGLVNGVDDVNGVDLVEWMSENIQRLISACGSEGVSA